MTPANFTKKLLVWHQTIERPMPWKGEKNPYLIWLSEIMLQQTRVEQGTAYYLTFKKKYPDVKSLAAASEDEVLQLWQGLGYNTRARNLLAAARFIQQELNGKFPKDYEGIRALKGVGDYTAAAIASFAFGLSYPVVDGNVYRVLSRVFGIETPIDSTSGKKQFQLLSQRLIEKQNSAAYNQAIMDFGALQCVPSKPDCQKCPMQNGCFAYQKKQVNHFPVKEKKIKQKQRYFHYLVIHEKNHVYLTKRTGNDIWKNMYEFPMIESNHLLSPEELKKSAIWKHLFAKQKISINEPCKKLTQSLTHQKIQAVFLKIQISRPLDSEKLLRVKEDFLNNFAFPGIIRLYLKN